VRIHECKKLPTIQGALFKIIKMSKCSFPPKVLEPHMKTGIHNCCCEFKNKHLYHIFLLDFTEIRNLQQTICIIFENKSIKMKTKLLFLAFALIIITGCSKDDDSILSNNNLIGTWEETVTIEYRTNEVPDEDWAEPGEYIYEITDKTITVFTENTDMLFNGQPLAYTYSQEDGEMIYLGFLIKVRFKSINELILENTNSERRSELHLKRID